MKRFFLFVLVSLFCLLPDKIIFAADNITAIFPAIPAENYANSLILSTDSNKAIVDGQLKTGANVKMRNGMVWLPLRFIAENLGWQVDYDNGNIILEHNGQKIQMQIGSADILLNGQTQKVAAAPYEENGTVWLPMRTVGETLNKQIDWLENFQTYYSEPYKLPHKLIFMYDKNSDFPTEANTSGIDHFYDCCLSSLYNDKNIVFADKYITVFIKDNQLFLQDLYYADFEPQLLNNGSSPIINPDIPNIIDKSSTFTNGICFWQETPNGWLMRRNESNGWDLRGCTTLYYLDNKNIRQAHWRFLTEEINFAAIQVLTNGVLTLHHFDNEDVWDYNKTNLTYYDFATGTKHQLGTPGYFYGFDVAGTFQQWQIENNKVTIFGYDRRMETTEQQKQASYMQYTFSLPE